MASLDDLRHETIEECHDERVDVRAIDVGVGHDDNLIVAQFLDVCLAVAFAINAEAYADRLDDVHHRLGFEDAVPLHFLHIQNLTTQRKDGLEVAVAALLGRATCGVTLDEEDLALLRVLVRAVGELTGQSTTTHRVLALHALTSLAGGDTCGSGKHHLLTNLLCLLRMLLEIVRESLTHSLMHGTRHLGVAQLGLRLTFELRLSHLHRDDGGEAFAEVFACNLNLRLLNLLRDLRLLISISLQRTRQGHAETSEVCTTLDGVDIVHVGVDVLRVVGVVHDSHLDGYALLLGLQVDDIVDEMRAVTVDVAHELLQAVLGMEGLLTCVALFVLAKVDEVDGDAGIQVSQLTHTTCDDVPLVGGGGEDGGVWPELLARSRLVGVANNLHIVERLALLILLLIDVSVAEHLRNHVCRQSVHTRHADTVQTTRHLIGALVELTSGVEHGHDDLKGRLMHLLMLVDGNTAAVVLHGDGIILVDGYFDILAKASHCLVDGVIDGFVDQVMKTLLTDVANVHGGTLTHGLKAFEHLNIAR